VFRIVGTTYVRMKDVPLKNIVVLRILKCFIDMQCRIIVQQLARLDLDDDAIVGQY
jgi:hypothetical protein